MGRLAVPHRPIDRPDHWPSLDSGESDGVPNRLGLSRCMGARQLASWCAHDRRSHLPHSHLPAQGKPIPALRVEPTVRMADNRVAAELGQPASSVRQPHRDPSTISARPVGTVASSDARLVISRDLEFGREHGVSVVLAGCGDSPGAREDAELRGSAGDASGPPPLDSSRSGRRTCSNANSK